MMVIQVKASAIDQHDNGHGSPRLNRFRSIPLGDKGGGAKSLQQRH